MVTVVWKLQTQHAQTHEHKWTPLHRNILINMRPFGQDLLRSCAFPQYFIFTVPCIHKCTWAYLNHIYHLFIWYIEHAKMHILQYNKKGSVAWMETIIQYNSNPGWIQIRESDPVLVNKTQLVTKRNYSNNPKTTSNLTNKAPRHYDFQSNKRLVAWDNRRLTLRRISQQVSRF